MARQAPHPWLARLPNALTIARLAALPLFWWVLLEADHGRSALAFVVFDIEVVFLYPWAVAFNQLGLFALVEMAIFLLILIGGLVYAWKKGALEWV